MSHPILIEEKPNSPATVDENGLKASKRWSIIASSDVDAYQILVGKTGVQRGAVYRNSRGQVPEPFCRCQSLSIETHRAAPPNGEGYFFIDAFYATPSGSSGNEEKPIPGGPAVWRLRRNIVTIPIDVDSEGKPYVMSSFEPWDPTGQKRVAEESIYATWYVKGTDHRLLQRLYRPYAAKVNLKPFEGAEKGCLLCNGMDVEPPENGYMLVTAEFAHRMSFTIDKISNKRKFEGWWDVRFDRGRRRLIQDKAKNWVTVPILTKELDDEGNPTGRMKPIDDPVFLDGKGEVLLPTKTGTLLAGDVNRYLPFVQVRKPQEYIDFNKIPGLKR